MFGHASKRLLRDGLSMYLDPQDSECLASDEVTVQNLSRKPFRMPPVGMTSNVTQITVGDVQGTFTAVAEGYADPWHAFNHTANGSFYQSPLGSYQAATGFYAGTNSTVAQGTSYVGEYLELRIPVPARLSYYRLHPSSTSNAGWRSPRKFTVLGSKDEGVSWMLVDARDGLYQWTTTAKTFFLPQHSEKYTRFRIVVHEVGDKSSGGTDQVCVQIGEWELFCIDAVEATLQGGMTLRESLFFDFQGSGQYMSTNFAPQLSNNRPFSMECWYWSHKTELQGGTEACLVGNTQCQLGIQATGDIFVRETNADQVAVTVSTLGINLSDGAWHHIAVVANTSSLALYVDGSFVRAANRPAGTAWATTEAVVVGGKIQETYQTCRMGPVRIYTGRTLTPDEIRRNLSGDSMRMQISPQTQIVRKPALVFFCDVSNPACYSGTGSIVQDLSGNNNHLTIPSTFRFVNGTISCNGGVATTTQTFEFGGSKTSCFEAWLLVSPAASDTTAEESWGTFGFEFDIAGVRRRNGIRVANNSGTVYGRMHPDTPLGHTVSAQWMHVVYILAPTQHMFYVNGKMVAQNARTTIYPGVASFRVFGLTNSSRFRILRVYHDYQLTDAEVWANYVAEKDKFFSLNNVVEQDPNLVLDATTALSAFANTTNLPTFEPILDRIDFSSSTFLQIPAATFDFGMGFTAFLKVSFVDEPSLVNNFFLGLFSAQGSDLQRLAIGLTPGKTLRVLLSNATDGVQVVGTRVFQKNESVVLAIRLDPATAGGTISLWCNGTLDGVLSGAAAYMTNALRAYNTLNTDAQGQGGTRWALHQVNMFPAALSDAQMTRYNQLVGEGIAPTSGRPSLWLDMRIKAGYPGKGGVLYDLSGAANHCMLNDGATVVGDYVRLGASGYVHIPLLPVFTSNARTFSLSAWFRCNANDVGILTDGSPSGLLRFLHISADGKLRSTLTIGAITLQLETPQIVTDDTWHHTVLVYLPSSVQLWFDGVLVSSASRTLNAFSQCQLRAGQRFSETSTGSLDLGPIQIWFDKALTRREVRSTYLTQRFAYQDERGLRLHLDVSRSECYPGGGTTLFDLSGTSNHCTLMNGAGVTNGAIVLNTTGGTQYVQSTLAPNFAPPYALEVWFLSSGGRLFTNTGDCAILSNGSNVSISITQTGKVKFVDRTTIATSLISVDDSRWHHLFLVNTGKRVSFWIDGMRVHDAPMVSAILPSPSVLSIGGGVGDVFQHCLLGPVRLYAGRRLDGTRITRNLWMDRSRRINSVTPTLLMKELSDGAPITTNVTTAYNVWTYDETNKYMKNTYTTGISTLRVNLPTQAPTIFAYEYEMYNTYTSASQVHINFSTGDAYTSGIRAVLNPNSRGFRRGGWDGHLGMYASTFTPKVVGTQVTNSPVWIRVRVIRGETSMRVYVKFEDDVWQKYLEYGGADYSLFKAQAVTSVSFLDQGNRGELRKRNFSMYAGEVFPDLVELRIQPRSMFDRLNANTQVTAKCIYSLRLLTEAYTGPIVRLRRVNDGQTQDFYGDMFGNLTSQPDSKGISWETWAPQGASISIWYDQSGRANHATQSNVSQQPLMKSGEQVVNFNSGRFFVLPNGTVPTGNLPYTVMCKHGAISGPTTRGVTILFSGSAVNHQANAFMLKPGWYYHNYWWNNDFSFDNGITESSAVGRTMSVTYNGTSMRGFSNAYPMSSRTPSISRNSTSLNNLLGNDLGNNYFDGELHFLFVFESELSDAERFMLETSYST